MPPDLCADDTRRVLAEMCDRWLPDASADLVRGRFEEGLQTYGQDNHLRADFPLNHEHLAEAADNFAFACIGHARGQYSEALADRLCYHASEILRLLSESAGETTWLVSPD
jgi:hypothetical protein